MKKIPNLFDYASDNSGVIEHVRKGCEWVGEGQCIATEKLDGTNVRLTSRCGQIVRVEKRRNPSRMQKKLGMVDPWYTDTCATDPVDKHIIAAVQNMTLKLPDGEHFCEAIGPKIQCNSLRLEKPDCVPFMLVAPCYSDVPTTFDGLREYLRDLESLYSPGHLAEGLVFRDKNGRMAKIRRKDFRRYYG